MGLSLLYAIQFVCNGSSIVLATYIISRGYIGSQIFVSF